MRVILKLGGYLMGVLFTLGIFFQIQFGFMCPVRLKLKRLWTARSNLPATTMTTFRSPAVASIGAPLPMQLLLLLGDDAEPQ